MRAPCSTASLPQSRPLLLLLLLLLSLLGSAPSAPGQQSAQAVRRELREIYAALGKPEKIDTIDGLLEQYAGHESVLLAAVKKKYGLDDEQADDGERTDGAGGSSCDADDDSVVVWPNATGGAGCDDLRGPLPGAEFFRPLAGGVDAFTSQYWGRSPLALKRSVCQPNANYGAAGLDDLVRLFPGAFSSVDQKQDLALLSFREGDMYVNLQRLYANAFVAYLDGVSMIVNSADCHWGESAAWALQLRSALPHVFESAPTLNIYLTPAAAESSKRTEAGGGGGGVQPFPLHNDEQDVYILQISGAKNWRVQHEPSRRYKGQIGGGIDQPDVPAMRTLLQKGDMLYIPRHHNHEGWTSDSSPSVSVSVTMGYNQSKKELQTGEHHHNCQQRSSSSAAKEAQQASGKAMSAERSVIALRRDWVQSIAEKKDEKGQGKKSDGLGSAGGVAKKVLLEDVSRRLKASSEPEARKPKQVVRKIAMAVRELLRQEQEDEERGAAAAGGGGAGLSIAALHRALESADPLETLSICICLNWLQIGEFR